MNWHETEHFLKQAIQAKRGAQTRIAGRLGIKVPSVASYITGSGKIPSEHLDAILEELELTIELTSTAGLTAPLAELLNMVKRPDEQYFESDEGGRRVYHYGETDLGKITDMVWYDPKRWWLKIRHPQITQRDFGILHKIADNGVVPRFRVQGGPFAGVELANSRHLLFIVSPEMEGQNLAYEDIVQRRKRPLDNLN